MKKEEALKETAVGFQGGLKVDLNKKLAPGVKLRDKLESHLKQLLDIELKNWEPRRKKIVEWEKQYSGYRPPKTTPFMGAANTVHPLTRSAVDTVYVRAEEDIMGRDKIWITEPTDKDNMDLAKDIEAWFDHYEKTRLMLRHKARKPIKEAFKMGEGVVALLWEDEVRPCWRYATEKEVNDPKVTTYSLSGTDRRGIKYKKTVYSGPDLFHIDNLDWIMSSDCDDPDLADMCGFRKYFTDAKLQLKVAQGFFDKKSVEKMINPDEFDEKKKEKSRIRRKELDKLDEHKPFEVWHLWTRFDTNGDGIEDEIVVDIHESGTILNAIYNPLFSGKRPFIVFCPYDGEGIVEILEKIQIHLDTIQNQRLDRMTQMNGPMFLYNVDALDEDFAVNPGKVYASSIANLDNAVKMLQFPDGYYSTFDEEDRLVAAGQMAVGIAPENIGQPTAERPVFKEMFARVQEANKKFKSLKDNLILGLERMGWLLIEYFAQYKPSYEYTTEVEGVNKKQTVIFPMEEIYDGLKLKLSASSEIMNQDVRREINVNVYHLLSDYMTKSAGMIQAIANPMIPPPVKQWFIEQYQIGATIVKRILEDFDIKDADELVSELDEQFAQAMAQPPQPQQMPMGPQGQMPQQGQMGQPPQMQQMQ